MDPFHIIIRQHNNKYRLTVEQKLANNEIERYEVKANNHSFLFECNRPAMVAKNHEHLAWGWSLIAGSDKSSYFLNEIVTELEKSLRRIIWEQRAKT